ncbi:hypothetical protein F5050DRAFT_1794085 [Lentinula boryana]|uniref:Uncharacterized protein n=1 Tax=Lentinula boryana TaxID=40481 RepID=A0ABQ8Q180_9AGAR|nr:hypothetical protein F5050DRAFT_1794085 [Lentinula boryana]
MLFQSASNGEVSVITACSIFFMNTEHYDLLLSTDSSLSISSGLLSPLPELEILKGFEEGHISPTLSSSGPPSPLLGLNLRNIGENQLTSSSLISSGRLSPLYGLTSLRNFDPAPTSSSIMSSSSEVSAIGDGHDGSAIHKARPNTSIVADQYTDKKQHNRDHAEDQVQAPPSHSPDVLSCWETGPFSFIACSLPSDVDQELYRSGIGSSRIPDREGDPIISSPHQYRWHGQRTICAPVPLRPLQQRLREMEKLGKMVKDLVD